jgi:hypothetical protein
MSNNILEDLVTEDNVTNDDVTNKNKNSKNGDSKKDKVSTNNNKFNDFSRRYFSYQGQEIAHIVVEKLRCVWVRVDNELFEEFCISKNINIEDIIKSVTLAKNFVLTFEKYLLQKKIKLSHIKEIKLEAIADTNVQTVLIDTNNKYYNRNEENEVTYANGTARLNLKFDDDYEMVEEFEFSDGPMGNGATPNGHWIARKHPNYGVKGNPKFSVSEETDDHQWKSVDMPSFLLYEKKVTKSKPRKPISAYKNRGSMLIHCTNENITNYPNASDPNSPVKAKGGTEGCIGIVGNENSWRYLPFFASYIVVKNEFEVITNFTNNKNVGYKLYNQD